MVRRRLTYRNLFLTMLIGGLWHGGGVDVRGVGGAPRRVPVRRAVGQGAVARAEPGQVLPDRAGSVLQGVLTFNLVCLAWIFFRADSVATAFDVIWGILASEKPSELVTPFLLLVIVLSLASQFVPPRFAERVQWRFGAMALGLQAVAFAAALTVIDVLGPDGVPPFIYFRSDATTRRLRRAPPPAATSRSSAAGGCSSVDGRRLRGGGPGQRRRLVERAEEKPFGAARDRSLAIWHPVQDIAHVAPAQPTGPRRLAGGNEDEAAAASRDDRSDPDGPPDAVRPEVRAAHGRRAAPRATSLATRSIRDFGESRSSTSPPTDPRYDDDAPLRDRHRSHPRPTSTTGPPPSPPTWRAPTRRWSLVLFGGNDAQGIVEPDGSVYRGPSDPGWRAGVRPPGRRA